MIVVMGATDHVGGRIADILLARGERLRVIDRSSNRLDSLANRGAEPRPGDALDTAFLASTFKGADAVFTTIPPDSSIDHVRAFQNGMSESITSALVSARVSHVVNLSGLGAELEGGTGLIQGLHEFERRLDRVVNLNVLHLRSAWLMENLLASVPMIATSGINSSALSASTPLPLVAANDVGDVAAERLLRGNFMGSVRLEVLGPATSTMAEITAEIGKTVGRFVRYVTLTPRDAEASLRNSGLTPELAALSVETSLALNEGRLREGIEPAHRGRTSLQSFLNRVFLPAYRKALLQARQARQTRHQPPDLQL